MVSLDDDVPPALADEIRDLPRSSTCGRSGSLGRALERLRRSASRTRPAVSRRSRRASMRRWSCSATASRSSSSRGVSGPGRDAAVRGGAPPGYGSAHALRRRTSRPVYPSRPARRSRSSIRRCSARRRSPRRSRRPWRSRSRSAKRPIRSRLHRDRPGALGGPPPHRDPGAPLRPARDVAALIHSPRGHRAASHSPRSRHASGRAWRRSSTRLPASACRARSTGHRSPATGTDAAAPVVGARRP